MKRKVPYGKNYSLSIEKFLSPQKIDLCARIVHLLFFGTTRGYKAVEIPAFLEEELGVPQDTTRALAEQLYRWFEEDNIAECFWTHSEIGWRTECKNLYSTLPKDLATGNFYYCPNCRKRIRTNQEDTTCES